MQRNDRWRPVPGGVSVGHPRVTAGSAGCYLWLGGKAYLASNNHVIADSGLAQLGDVTLQPGAIDGGDPSEDIIGHLSHFVPFTRDQPNKVDLALAEVALEYVDDRILGFASGDRIIQVEPGRAEIGEEVVKSGRTTGLTYGRVISTEASLMIQGYPQGTLLFEDSLVIEGEVAGGDSGSAIIGVADGALLGLLFAGSVDGKLIIACKIRNVIEALRQAPGFRPALAMRAQGAKFFIPMALGGLLLGNGIYFGRGGRG